MLHWIKTMSRVRRLGKINMIRKFQKADGGQVMKIWLNGNVDAHPFIPEAYWKSNYSAVEEQILQADVFVCEANGEIQGFIGIVKGYIAGIFVDRKYRSLGIGKQLLDYAKQKYSSLSLDVYQKNGRAAAFYIREGFAIISEDSDKTVEEAEYNMVWQAQEK